MSIKEKSLFWKSWGDHRTLTPWATFIAALILFLFGLLFLLQKDDPNITTVGIPLILAGGGITRAEEMDWGEGILQAAREMGAFIGCGDSIFYLEEDITATQDPLSHVYDRLFDMGSVVVHEGIEYVNPIGFHTETRTIGDQTFAPLSFESVVVENATAQIYLGGEYVSIGTCEPLATEAVLEFAALQFKEVNTVEIFLNGEQLNFTPIE